MKVVITGAGGQLGKAFQREFDRRNIACVGVDIATCNITNQREVEDLLDAHKPTVLINCAAYNLVDDAETKRDAVYAVNAQAVKVLALACQSRGIKLVHYSTDYVFNGQKGDLYVEDDVPHPLNVYGLSKFEGETLAQMFTTDHLILRTSWLYGEGQQNFLYKALQWAKQAKVLRVSADEVSVPTSAELLVEMTLMALDKKLSGLYHVTSSGYASRYELAKYFLKAMGMDVMVIPVPLAYFKPKVARPLFSAMSNKKISSKLGIVIPEWQDGIASYVQKYF
jgi:dTDP-4-dehydrorhamnose reductase